MVQEITKLIKRQEVRHPEKVNKTTSPIKRKPDWIRVKAPNSKTYHETRDLMREWKLTTVCEEAACPNIGECWSKKHATMMILGGICTRACAFCNVTTGRPNAVDLLEPENVAEAVEEFVERAVEAAEDDVSQPYTIAEAVTEVQTEQFLQDPIGELINIDLSEISVASVGDDMTSDQKEKAQEVVVPVIIVAQIASMTSVIPVRRIG